MRIDEKIIVKVDITPPITLHKSKKFHSLRFITLLIGLNVIWY
jgi:hypothetical protein